MNLFDLLPVELISPIFIISHLSANRVHHIGVNNWRLVCKRWNETAVATAELWTDISLSRSLQLKLKDASEREEYGRRIERAGILPLRILIGPVLPKYFDTLQVIVPYLGQANSLEIWQEPDLRQLALWDGTRRSGEPKERNARDRRGLFPFHLKPLFDILQRPMPLLEELSLQLRVMAPAEITVDAPALRSLRSHCQYVTIYTKQAIAFNSMTLKHGLVISDAVPGPGNVPSFQLHLLESSLAGLERLTLSHPHTHLLRIPPIQEIHLPSLKELIIHRVSKHLVPVISAPTLEILVVYIWGNDDSRDVVDISKYDSLTAFVIDGTTCHEKELENWRMMPSIGTCSPTLNKLAIRGPMRDPELLRALHSDVSLLPNLEELDLPFAIPTPDDRLLLADRPKLRLRSNGEHWEPSNLFPSS